MMHTDHDTRKTHKKKKVRKEKHHKHSSHSHPDHVKHIPTLEEKQDPLSEFYEPEEERDDELRQKAVEEFREWVLKQPHFVNCRTDDKFLLRFLRTRKYCMSSAQETLDRYLTVRTHHPIFFQNLDITDPPLRDLMSKGYFFPLYDKDGEDRTVVFGVAGALSTTDHKAVDIYRAFAIVFEALLEDEENQKNGVTYILDEAGFRLSHLGLVNLREAQRVMLSGEKGLPMRHKGIHWVNVPRYLTVIYDLVLSFFPPKLQKRMFVYHDVRDFKDKVCNTIHPRILPEEYGGTHSIQEMSATWIKRLEELRELLLSMDSMGVDESKRIREKKQSAYGIVRFWNSLTRSSSESKLVVPVVNEEIPENETISENETAVDDNNKNDKNNNNNKDSKETPRDPHA